MDHVDPLAAGGPPGVYGRPVTVQAAAEDGHGPAGLLPPHVHRRQLVLAVLSVQPLVPGVLLPVHLVILASGGIIRRVVGGGGGGGQGLKSWIWSGVVFVTGRGRATLKRAALLSLVI